MPGQREDRRRAMRMAQIALNPRKYMTAEQRKEADEFARQLRLCKAKGQAAADRMRF